MINSAELPYCNLCFGQLTTAEHRCDDRQRRRTTTDDPKIAVEGRGYLYLDCVKGARRGRGGDLYKVRRGRGRRERAKRS